MHPTSLGRAKAIEASADRQRSHPAFRYGNLDVPPPRQRLPVMPAWRPEGSFCFFAPRQARDFRSWVSERNWVLSVDKVRFHTNCGHSGYAANSFVEPGVLFQRSRYANFATDLPIQPVFPKINQAIDELRNQRRARSPSNEFISSTTSNSELELSTSAKNLKRNGASPSGFFEWWYANMRTSKTSLLLRGYYEPLLVEENSIRSFSPAVFAIYCHQAWQANG